MAAIVLTEKDVMSQIDAINAGLIGFAYNVTTTLSVSITELNNLMSTSLSMSSDVTNAITALIDDAPTAEQKTQLSNLLALYNTSLDAANTVSRLFGNMSSTINSVTSSVSKSNATLVMQSAINMPVLP
jgi:hypothetical protein